MTNEELLRLQKIIHTVKASNQAAINVLEKQAEILSAMDWDLLDVIHGEVPVEQFLLTHAEALGHA